MNTNNKGIFAVVLGVIAALWCLVVLVFIDKTGAAFDYWGGFAFGLVAIITPLILSLTLRLNTNRATKEIAMIQGFCFIPYLIFGIIFNGVFVFLKTGDHKIVIVVVNVLALVAYLVTAFGLVAYLDRVNNLSSTIGGKAYQITQIKSEIGVLLALCGTGEVRERLLALKSKVDCSDNIAQAVTQNEEYLFYNQIKGVEDLIRNKAFDEDILKLISEAESTWNIRNAKLTTVR